MGTDVTDEDKIIGIRLAYDISNLPVQSIVESVDVSGIANPIPVDTVNQPINVTEQYDVQIQNQDQTTSIASGGDETVTFTPPAGYAWIIKGISFFVNPVPTATSGDHFHNVSIGNLQMSQIKSAYNSGTGFRWNEIKGGGTTKAPPTAEAMLLAFKEAVVTPVNPLEFYYYNGSDVTQTETRKYRLNVREVRRET